MVSKKAAAPAANASLSGMTTFALDENTGELTIRMPLLAEPRVSSGGKVRIAGSTGGFAVTGIVWNGHPLRVNVNATVPLP